MIPEVSKILESNNEYDVFVVPLGKLYVFKARCTSGEFKGAVAGTSRMKYNTDNGPRPIALKQKHRNH
jgi:hypothetical protein